MSYGKYNHQGYFGESFVRVLASAAGLIAGQQVALRHRHRDVALRGVVEQRRLPQRRPVSAVTES